MKKTVSVIISLILLLTLFAGCESKESGKKGFSVVTTVFPVYDWAREVIGSSDGVSLEFLLDSGADLHSYQPTADDIIKIADCDLFIYVGGESDKWVNDALKEAKNKNMAVLDLMEKLGDSVKSEKTVEGMQTDGEDAEEEEYDEHIWLSLKNADACVKAIKEELCEADSANKEKYEENASAYSEKLNFLDKEFESAAETAQTKTVLFADRFPFRYLTDDYSLKYYAAFSGCSAESEASFETVKFLADKTDELGLKYVFTIDGSNKKIAKTVISATKLKSAEILTLDSMQSATEEDVKNGITYLSVMEKNLKTLKKAIEG